MGKLKGRGGAGRGQGRKANPLKDVNVGVETAQKFLRQINEVQQLIELYNTSKDWRGKVYILFKCRDWAYQKPPQAVEHKGSDDSPVKAVVEVRFVKPGDDNSSQG